MYVITIVLLVTYAVADQHKIVNTGLRVHSGVDDSTGKYPYVVALKGAFPALDRFCTGSLITDTWVLSASHCLSPIIKYVQYGNMSKPLFETDTKSIVLKMIRHPAYLKLENYVENMYSDIGLIMIQRVLNMPKYARISAVDYRTLLGQAVEYAGFGMTFFPTKDTKNKIQELIIDIFRPLQIGEAVVTPCEEIPRRNLICARAKCSHNQQMILHGDSGGPLMFDNKIVGVSFAIIMEKFEQAFTPVSPFLPWIHSVVTADYSPPKPVNDVGRLIRIRNS